MIQKFSSSRSHLGSMTKLLVTTKKILYGRRKDMPV
nr:MAG TPA: hypothetical protein [Bacteriophage sp.]